MEVFFVDVNDTGNNIIHEFGCPLSKPSDREFLGLFINPKDAVRGALLKFTRVVVCSGCCIDGHE
jgi:hypothetical protein